MRTLAKFAVVLGAAGSLVLLLREGIHTPRFLLALFIVWVLSPFALLTWANWRRRWGPTTRAMLYWMTGAVAALSLLMYAGLIPRPGGTHVAFVYLMVPLVSWIFMITVLVIAALADRSLSERSSGR
ncbi:MAG TPA: hypothetical protein VJY35_00815 [Candidatus Eisenbacteria bacterium]|nr:hypothetical protein [Candidatus Eisenbacteria bacterium]